MNTTQALRRSSPARSAAKAGTGKRVATATLAGEKTVAARLAKLTAGAMPWLSKDTDLTPPDGGPETVGPAAYPPTKHG